MQIYTLSDGNIWDELVSTFTHYDVYYLSEYVKGFEINGDGTPILLYFEDENFRAINVVMKRDISELSFFRDKLAGGEYYDLCTPYGYGGWIVEPKKGKKVNYYSLKEDYMAFCRREGIVCEFVRFHPLLENWNGMTSIYQVTNLGKTVAMDTTSEEVIWNNITSKNRNMIRKAQKSGLEVFWGRDPSIIPHFIDIYNHTMKKDLAEDYYYFKEEFYKSILFDMKWNAMWFWTKKDNQIAAISIFMFCNGKMHYHLSASREEYRKYAPTNLLLYQAALWANKNGIKQLHMGGGLGAQQDNLYKFKKAFNRKTDFDFCVGKAIFSEDKYNILNEIRSKCDEGFVADTNFFPAYRS